MKTWKITLKAKDEKSALVYLDILRDSFKSSIALKERMKDICVEDSDNGEKMTCRRKIFGIW